MVIPLGLVGPSVAVKEKRLAALLGGAPALPGSAAQDLEDARLLGSLELSGIAVSWEEATGDRQGDAVPEVVSRLREAQRSVDPGTPLSTAVFGIWQGHLAEETVFRRGEASADSLATLSDWMASPATLALAPARQGALVLARLTEVPPFDRASARLARLAASHVMVRSGSRPPILVGADGPRLEAALVEAMALSTGPLVALLEEAARRALDILVQSLERRERGKK